MPSGAPTPGEWQDHHQHLATLGSWKAYGKVAVRSSDQSDTANMTWQQDGATTQINLSGPLGSGATRLRSNGTVLTIERGGEIRRVDISSAEAVRANTGWDLPLQVLPYWLRGIPFPHTDIEELTTEPNTGQLATLRQNGWDVRYEKYRVFDGFALPTRLRMERGATRATVLVRHWQPGKQP